MENRFFPSTKREALALLYLQSQDLSMKTPEELAAMYQDAYVRIDAKLDEIRTERKEQRQSRDLSMF